METSEKCFFSCKFSCEDKPDRLVECGPSRVATIIKCSHIYDDGIAKELEDNLNENRNCNVTCHKNCVSTYTSTTQTQRHMKRKKQATTTTNPKKSRRTSSTTFNFQCHCIFCGEACDIEKTNKNPTRWREAYLCREIEQRERKTTLKQAILKVCDLRDDEVAANVRLRVEGVISDLHAADARYHVDCRSTFMSPRSVNFAASAGSKDTVVDDAAFDSLIADVQEDLSHMWNSVELMATYRNHGGNRLSRKLILKNLCDYFGDDLLVLTSAGIASIIVFRSRASSVLRLVDVDEDDLDASVTKVSKQIKLDVKSIPTDTSHYKTQISRESAIESVSDTLMQLLANLSPKLDNTLPAILIGSIITSALHHHPTSLQIDLGVLIRGSKALINEMHAFGVTCSYDEVRRFKKSAALAATDDIALSGISNVDSGLIQVVADNFDADISSQNGKLSTHSLAVLLTQPDENLVEQNGMQKIKRIKQERMAEPVDYEVNRQVYNGPKRPELPKETVVKSVPSLKVLANTALVRQRADEFDIAFLNDVITSNRCPEFNGYNTAACRQQGHAPKPKTKAVYLPLIDMTPSDPDTMMTALRQAQQLSREAGQEFVVFTCDLQLYRVALKVIWAYPDRFSNVVMRLGGMHSLMSFVGSIGTLMAESGLADIMSDVFGGVPKMLSGKKFPQNVRAMRMVAEEILRGLMERTPFGCKQELMDLLEDLASKSKTAKLWIDVLIKPVFIMMKFIRAEREGDWLLHLDAFRDMMPYFFAAGHVHYARFGLIYIRSMESLPADVFGKFMRGEHVMRHTAGIWNGIWSDMFIETTFMRYGHGKSGIIGITLKPEALKTWALSLHICSGLESDLAAMADNERADAAKSSHKEEQKGRISSDASDRQAIRQKLEMCINPLDPETHPSDIVSIVSGSVYPSSVNVHDAINIGRKMMEGFEESFPSGFYETIHKKVFTMATKAKHIRIGEAKVFDTTLIYSKVIGLQASSRDIDIKDILCHELAPIPTSLFTEAGDMRIAKAKSVLKRKLQVEVSERNAADTDSIVIDGSALLWVVHWPAGGKVKDFVDNVRRYIGKRLESGDVYLIFDRYHDYSTKSVARGARAATASRVHKLTPDTVLPAQKVLLTVSENKKKLTAIICSELLSDKLFRDRVHEVGDHKLVITGDNMTPVQISSGGVVHRTDLNTRHEEADTIIVQQVLVIAKEKPSGIRVLSDDTDVFVLLLHVYLEDNLKILVVMESPAKQRVVVDIGKTVEKHRTIIPELLPAHALSGCDTVACCFGIGKGRVIKVVQSGLSLSLLGQTQADMPAVMQQATKFMTACYGQQCCQSMSAARFNVWAEKTGKGYTSTPKLCTLPPTTESFEENIKRAHLQACMWRDLRDSDPPDLDPQQYGWKKDEPNRALLPLMVPDGVALAPAAILRLIRCGCQSDSPCASARCGCNSANLPCTVFCRCHGIDCNNISTV